MGVMGMLTGVFDLSEGLDAVEGVFGRASREMVRADGTMMKALSKSCVHSSKMVRYLVRRERYMKSK
jgi:hypothetical protein